MYTGALHLPITPAIMYSLLAKYKLLELVEQGVLVVYSEEGHLDLTEQRRTAMWYYGTS